MGLIPMIQWRVIEILQRIQKILGRVGKCLEVFIESAHLSLDRSPLEMGLDVEKKNNAMVALLQEEMGFRYIVETNWKSTSGFPSFFLPCRVLLNQPFSLFRTKSLSSIL